VISTTLALMLCAYLIGSIPFSHLIARWRTGLNLRDVGEGNVGSRNVWHVVGPAWGILAGVFDVLKGFVCYLVASALLPTAGALAVGVAVLLGHQFPIFLRGRGGKGLATALGVLLAVSPLSTLTGLTIFVLASLALRNFNTSVVPGIIAIIVLPPLFHQPLWVSVYALGVALLLALKKALDHQHDEQVWATHPWQGGATPGFSRASDDNTSVPQHETPQN